MDLSGVPAATGPRTAEKSMAKDRPGVLGPINLNWANVKLWSRTCSSFR